MSGGSDFEFPIQTHSELSCSKYVVEKKKLQPIFLLKKYFSTVLKRKKLRIYVSHSNNVTK